MIIADTRQNAKKNQTIAKSEAAAYVWLVQPAQNINKEMLNL